MPIFKDFLRNRCRDELSAEDLQALEASIHAVQNVPARHNLAISRQPIGNGTYLNDGFICRDMDDREGVRQLVAVQ
jgi:hypothetical protein